MQTKIRVGDLFHSNVTQRDYVVIKATDPSNSSQMVTLKNIHNGKCLPGGFVSSYTHAGRFIPKDRKPVSLVFS